MKEYLLENIEEDKNEPRGSRNFRLVFFSIYDQKIASGELKFTEIGMNKEDFTNMCINKDFILPRDKIIDLSIRLKMTREQAVELLEAAGYYFKG